jgi:hypothetical protein
MSVPNKPARLPKELTRLRVKRQLGQRSNPCLTVLSSLLNCWASNAEGAAVCKGLEDELRSCMSKKVCWILLEACERRVNDLGLCWCFLYWIWQKQKCGHCYGGFQCSNGDSFLNGLHLRDVIHMYSTMTNASKLRPRKSQPSTSMQPDFSTKYTPRAMTRAIKIRMTAFYELYM